MQLWNKLITEAIAFLFIAQERFTKVLANETVLCHVHVPV